MLSPLRASAQEQQEQHSLEEIVVTGSRIVRSNIVSPNPITQVGEDDVNLSGDVNIVDIVNDVPALLGSADTTDNAILQGSIGAATLDLRNLGSERTLVLVNGRRHVGGISGEATVDVNTIPTALVERVEVLTGGASAIYGADAVSGVVNFILKDDFEGLTGRAQYNISDKGDGAIYYFSTTGGTNFGGGRGNVTLSFSLEDHAAVQQGDRKHTRGDRIATDWPNPALRVQQADVAQFGLDRLLLGQSIGDFCGAGDTSLGAGRDPLCGRIQGAPSRAVLPFPRFAVSNYGSIIGVDFFGDGYLSFFPDPSTVAALGLDLGSDGVIFDFNNNGIEDCFETAEGTVTQRFGGFAGCHVIDSPGGAVRPFVDGLIADDINQFGGDGTNTGRDGADLIPNDRRYTVNATAHYDLTDSIRWFTEAKYVYSRTYTEGPSVNSFYDSIPILSDNPFIPADLTAAIDEFVSANSTVFNRDDVIIFLGRDPTDFGPNRVEAKRDVFRIVSGFKGDIVDTDFNYELSVNYGQTNADSTVGNAVVMDRLYAAIDAVVDPATNQIVCRSSLDPAAEPGAPFLPSRNVFPGFITFQPGDGSCVPINLFGVGAPSQEAIDFVTTTTRRERKLTQFVVSGYLSGNTSAWFELPAGAPGFAAGAEYRRETSKFLADTLEKPNPNIQTSAANPVQSIIFDPRNPVVDVSGNFDVWEVFGEVSLPILADLPFAEEVTIDAAIRYGDYSTTGGSTAWKVGGSWTPVSDIRFRGTYSRTIRAPNVNELFTPLTGATSAPVDPCDASQLGNGSQFRAANCAADGIPSTYTNPLTARVSGFTGGNPDLIEETAKTYTVGLVVQPRFIPGLTLSADYYNIRIADAIATVGVQEILNACYDAATFPNQFCGQIERDRDPASPTFLGLSSFVTAQLNFAALATRGVDYEVEYRFGLGEISSSLEDWGSVMLRFVGNYVNKLDRFEDPTDPSIVNPELLENGQPKHAFNIDGRWMWEGLMLNWQARYIGNILEITPRLQIENADDFLNAFAGSTWRHDFTGRYKLNERISFYGGINNITDAKPIISDANYPVGLMGRQFYIGIDVTL
ncbi:MAG: TonB-dependent receptor domain-containing protein [Pseudomonadota bacterium]